MTCGLVHASYCLPEWQAVKLTSFAPSEVKVISAIANIALAFFRKGGITH